MQRLPLVTMQYHIQELFIFVNPAMDT